MAPSMAFTKSYLGSSLHADYEILKLVQEFPILLLPPLISYAYMYVQEMLAILPYPDILILTFLLTARLRPLPSLVER